MLEREVEWMDGCMGGWMSGWLSVSVRERVRLHVRMRMRVRAYVYVQRDKGHVASVLTAGVCVGGGGYVTDTAAPFARAQGACRKCLDFVAVRGMETQVRHDFFVCQSESNSGDRERD